MARALRDFIIMGAVWAIYSPNAVVAGPVLSGYCLKAGLTDSQIAFLVSLTGLMGASQLLSYFFTRRFRDKRRMMVGLGVWEITFVSLVVVAGLKLPEAYRLYGIGGLLVLGLLFGHAVMPAWTSWMSNIIPGDIRSSYIGRKMFIISGVGVVYLLLAGRFLDVVPWPLNFLLVFAVGWLGGIGGYLVALVTPYPHMEEPERGTIRSLLQPLRESAFVRLGLFLVAWLTAGMMSGAFYSVYMLRYLGLSYSLVALFTNIQLLAMMLGYRLWGIVAQKFGNKPVIQLLAVPRVIVALLWALTTPGNYWIMLVSAMALGGLCGSGLSVTTSSLMFKTVPQGKDVSGYMVIWTLFNTVGVALGPFLAGLLQNSLGDQQLQVLGTGVSSMQVVFAISAAALLVPVVLSWLLQETEVASPVYVLGQFRGNLFSFAYNFALYGAAKADETRAGRLRALGRSRSPLAVSALLRGLQDTSPTVRQGAVEGLGESGLPEGFDPLLRTLEDEESDVRSLAAEAIGKLRKPEGVHPLIRTLHDEDIRLRNSAALALGEIGSAQAQEALYQALLEPFDRHTFATLVDAASRTGDLRIIEPAFQHLPKLRSPVVRMQVLNAVGRVIGERNHFYRLRIADRLGRAALVERMMARIVRLFRAVKRGTVEQRTEMQGLSTEIAVAAANDDYATFRPLCQRLASVVLGVEDALPVVYAGARSVLLYLQAADETKLEDEGLVFLTIALTSIARHLAPRPRQPAGPH